MRMKTLLIALCLAVAPAAASTSLSVSPVRADLSAAAPIASIALNNAGSEPMVMEATIQRWTQDMTGKWLLTPTTGVRVYPPQITVPAKGEAFVRVGLEGAEAGSYRLELSELVDHATLKAGAVRILTRISLPIFVPPPQGQQSLSANFTARLVAGAILARVENIGNMPFIPQEWIVQAGAEKPSNLPGYILPGGAFEWSTPLVECSAGAHLKLISERVTLSAPIQGCK